ncbi:hypothetical protein V6N12_027667 [Hibiscus sabdariffa]|uniref:Uncharacterized protein n=1 Tax=Hibiscus sabdariffa TaxID=183260 RepID=A0ABR2F3K7_9ROSI
MVDSASGSKSKSRVPGDLDLENFPPLEAVIEKESSDVTGAGNTASGPGQNWNLFNQTLNYFPPTKANGQILVKPPKDVLIDGARQWDNALLGNFLEAIAGGLAANVVVENSQNGHIIQNEIFGFVDGSVEANKIVNIPVVGGFDSIPDTEKGDVVFESEVKIQLGIENSVSAMGCADVTLVVEERVVAHIDEILGPEPDALSNANQFEVLDENQEKFNSIKFLENAQGHKLNTFEEISGELIQHFTKALGTANGNVGLISDALLREILGVELSANMKDSLVAPVTSKEIKDVIFSMNGSKAPGPDG